MKFDLGNVTVHKRRLPHWNAQHGFYFVTFSLFPSADPFMLDPRVATIVANAIEHFDGVRYELLAWCVMPDHVHIVLTLLNVESIEDVVQAWKSFTSKTANKVLGRTGTFWNEGYFDRCIRDDRELRETIEYLLNNPATAGLSDWQFVKLYAERIPV